MATTALKSAHPRKHGEALSEGQVVRLVRPGTGADLVGRHFLPAKPCRQSRGRQGGEQAAAGVDVRVQSASRLRRQVGEVIPVQPDDRRWFRWSDDKIGEGNLARLELGHVAEPLPGCGTLIRDGVVRLDEEDAYGLAHSCRAIDLPDRGLRAGRFSILQQRPTRPPCEPRRWE